MIYKRQEYVKEDEKDNKFPVKRIEVMEPVDEESDSRFVGQVALGMQTPVGVQQLPVSFEIEASSIEEAFNKFADEAEPKIEEMRQQVQQELQKARQKSSNKIVRPGEMNLQNQGNVIDFDNLKSE
ncbi:MAG: hypothetical protein KGZ25_11075 [Planctomycetes bacterium]|nr:hypothetical protein [Planctomycetota bacterium]